MKVRINKTVLLSLALTLVLLGAILLPACSPPDTPPAPVPTPVPTSIPGTSTFTQEGVFSISYPKEWTVDQEILAELSEMAVELLSEEDVTVDAFTFLFFVGIENADGSYYPNANLVIGPRGLGYWDLDDIVDTEVQYGKDYTEKFALIEISEIEIDGIDARIVITEDTELGYPTWRYLQMYVVKGMLVWMVTGACEAADYPEFEQAFYDIATSLRFE